MTKPIAPFIHEDFLLDSDPARRLYHDYARAMPIIDYHCHLSPAQIAGDHRFANLGEAWLGGDHYKWRAMRTNGVPERFCTGDASDREKYDHWAATMPSLLRNPLYHWTHLELARIFGISDRLLGPATAPEIWDEVNALLASPGYSARGLMKQAGVVLVCTTDDPTDTLEHHQALARDASFGIRVLPAWRPDKGMMVENLAVFNPWVTRLAERSGIEIRDFDTFMEALDRRHAFFHEQGCRLSDHGLETIYAEPYTRARIETIFLKARGGARLNLDDILKFKSVMLYEFAVMDHRRGWTQQFHLGALRNNNSRQFAALGPDTGFDSIGDFELARPLARLLDRLDRTGQLARTILYNLNPRDNALMASILGNFQDGAVPGKMQWGGAWWFLDQLDGMERHLTDLSMIGLLARFVGMLTDSRSFLSYPRHEYFRRLLCNLLGRDIERGLIPHDLELVGAVVRDICYNNAANYFGFDLPQPNGPDFLSQIGTNPNESHK